MKHTYIKPEIITEVLLQGDVLKLSTETDNSYVQSGRLIKDDFRIEDIL
ncbi:MAG: hypothetical protein K6F88_02300 [Ruminococcus sp.]|nr:hypothetical protein [Ruminococcus sp.]